jgi:hypothetical protein
MAVPARPTSGVPIETAWGQVAHDTAVAMDIQAGTVVVATTVAARNEVILTFPRPFAAPPTIVATAFGFQTTVANLTGTGTVTATQATICVMPNAGGSNAVGSVSVNWIAYGPRA